jgi:hypothetical protein
VVVAPPGLVKVRVKVPRLAGVAAQLLFPLWEPLSQ